MLSLTEILGHLRSEECQKKCADCQRINNMVRAAFTPLVSSTLGMAGPETQIFSKSLAAMACEKNVDLTISVVIKQLRTRTILACCVGLSPVLEVAVHHTNRFMQKPI